MTSSDLRNDLQELAHQRAQRLDRFVRLGWIAMGLVWICGIALGANYGLFATMFASEDEMRESLLDASASTKDELRQKRERFYRLSEDERTRLRSFHDELMAHPDREKLLNVLVRYNDWLKTLTPVKRAEIQDLPTTQRIRKIRDFREEEARRRLGYYGPTKLPDEDIPRLYNWIDQFVCEREDQILKLLSAERRAELQRSETEDVRRRRLAYSLSSFQIEQLEDLVEISDVESFFNNLSPEAQDILTSRVTNDDRVVLVQRWIRLALYARRMPKVDDDELEHFFREVINEDQRDQLDRMPPEQRQSRLKWMYYEWSQNRTRSQRRPSADSRPPLEDADENDSDEVSSASDEDRRESGNSTFVGENDDGPLARANTSTSGLSLSPLSPSDRLSPPRFSNGFFVWDPLELDGLSFEQAWDFLATDGPIPTELIGENHIESERNRSTRGALIPPFRRDGFVNDSEFAGARTASDASEEGMPTIESNGERNPEASDTTSYKNGSFESHPASPSQCIGGVQRTGPIVQGTNS